MAAALAAGAAAPAAAVHVSGDNLSLEAQRATPAPAANDELQGPAQRSYIDACTKGADSTSATTAWQASCSSRHTAGQANFLICAQVVSYNACERCVLLNSPQQLASAASCALTQPPARHQLMRAVPLILHLSCRHTATDCVACAALTCCVCVLTWICAGLG